MLTVKTCIFCANYSKHSLETDNKVQLYGESSNNQVANKCRSISFYRKFAILLTWKSRDRKNLLRVKNFTFPQWWAGVRTWHWILKKKVRIVISNAFNLPVNGRGEVSFSSKCSRMYLLNYRLSDAFSVGVTHFIWALLTLQREPEISLRLFYSIFVKFIDHSFPQNGLRNGDQWCLQFFS